MSLKSAEEWIGDLRGDGFSELGLVNVKDVRAIQADALLYAAELCRKRILRIKNGAHNIACTECSITLQAAAHELESGLGVTLYPVKDVKQPEDPKCGCPSVACPIHGLPSGSASGGW